MRSPLQKRAFRLALRDIAEILNNEEITWCVGSISALYLHRIPIEPEKLIILVAPEDFEQSFWGLQTHLTGQKLTRFLGDKPYSTFVLALITYPTEVLGYPLPPDSLPMVSWEDLTVPVHSLQAELEMYKKQPGKEAVVALIKERL